MPKTKITDYSTTRSSNADLDGLNIAEGCPAGNHNDAMRELMVQLAETNAGTYPVADTWSFGDPADLTKRVRFDAGSITTATTRVVTLPDQDITITAAGAAVMEGADAVAQLAVLQASPLVHGNVLAPHQGLIVNVNAVAALDVDATAIVLFNTSGNGRRFATINLTISIAASGANGLDTGSEANSTWYHIWVIAKADGTVAGLFSTSASSPTMPTD